MCTFCCILQDLRKRLEAERDQKEQYARQLTSVREEVAAAAQSAQEDAALAQEQVIIFMTAALML